MMKRNIEIPHNIITMDEIWQYNIKNNTQFHQDQVMYSLCKDIRDNSYQSVQVELDYNQQFTPIKTTKKKNKLEMLKDLFCFYLPHTIFRC